VSRHHGTAAEAASVTGIGIGVGRTTAAGLQGGHAHPAGATAPTAPNGAQAAAGTMHAQAAGAAEAGALNEAAGSGRQPTGELG
jgi:hypothetical protein